MSGNSCFTSRFALGLLLFPMVMIVVIGHWVVHRVGSGGVAVGGVGVVGGGVVVGVGVGPARTGVAKPTNTTETTRIQN